MRHYERRNLPAIVITGSNRIQHVCCQIISAIAAPDPAADRAGNGFNICMQGRIRWSMSGCVLPNHHHDRRPGPPRIMQIGQAISQTGAKMQDDAKAAHTHLLSLIN